MTSAPDIKILNQPLLRNEPLYGVFVRWPEDGEKWVHPLDIGVVRHLLPSSRVFRRLKWNSEFYEYHYGKLSFRAKPKMWMLLEFEGLDVGDYVEVKSMMGKNCKIVARIVDMFWDRYKQAIEYRVQGFGRSLQRRFLAEELQLIPRLDKPTGKHTWQPPLHSVAHEINGGGNTREFRGI